MKPLQDHRPTRSYGPLKVPGLPRGTVPRLNFTSVVSSSPEDLPFYWGVFPVYSRPDSLLRLVGRSLRFRFSSLVSTLLRSLSLPDTPGSLEVRSVYGYWCIARTSPGVTVREGRRQFNVE